MKSWVIYTLSDPLDGRPRYVGVTCNPRSRLSHHVTSSARGDNRWPVQRWIIELLAAGRKPIMTTIENGTGGRDCAERAQIARHRAEYPDLLNLSDGGHIDVPPEARKRAGEKLKNRYFSPEHRRRISEAKRGCKRPDVTDRNRAQNHLLRGKKLNLSDAERARRSELGSKLGSANSKKRWAAMDDEARQQNAMRARGHALKFWATADRAEMASKISAGVWKARHAE